MRKGRSAQHTPEENIIGWENMVRHRQERIANGETVPELDPPWLTADHYQPKGASKWKSQHGQITYSPPASK